MTRSEVFVDTSALYAFLVAEEAEHRTVIVKNDASCFSEAELATALAGRSIE